jgi:hypothetical protein
LSVGHRPRLSRARVAEPSVGAWASVIELTDTQRRLLVALCRPYRKGNYPTPATNPVRRDLAAQSGLSAISCLHNMHYRALGNRLGRPRIEQTRRLP